MVQSEVYWWNFMCTTMSDSKWCVVSTILIRCPSFWNIYRMIKALIMFYSRIVFVNFQFQNLTHIIRHFSLHYQFSSNISIQWIDIQSIINHKDKHHGKYTINVLPDFYHFLLVLCVDRCNTKHNDVHQSNVKSKLPVWGSTRSRPKETLHKVD